MTELIICIAVAVLVYVFIGYEQTVCFLGVALAIKILEEVFRAKRGS
jgi:hypothetical protein